MAQMKNRTFWAWVLSCGDAKANRKGEFKKRLQNIHMIYEMPVMQ